MNLGKGWKKRLFVLERGVLRYYKVSVRTGVRVRLGAGFFPGVSENWLEGQNKDLILQLGNCELCCLGSESFDSLLVINELR